MLSKELMSKKIAGTVNNPGIYCPGTTVGLFEDDYKLNDKLLNCPRTVELRFLSIYIDLVNTFGRAYADSIINLVAQASICNTQILNSAISELMAMKRTQQADTTTYRQDMLLANTLCGETKKTIAAKFLGMSNMTLSANAEHYQWGFEYFLDDKFIDEYQRRACVCNKDIYYTEIKRFFMGMQDLFTWFNRG